MIKYNSDLSIARFKARLFTKGFHPTYESDYTENFCPMIKASTIRVILSLAVLNRWMIGQVDINNTFLNGILSEDVYMSQLKGFVDHNKPQHICKLKKALYSLKEFPRAWFDRFAMISHWHFQNAKLDNYLFYKWSSGHLILVLVYVDETIITYSSSYLIQEVIQDMHKT